MAVVEPTRGQLWSYLWNGLSYSHFNRGAHINRNQN